MVMGDITMRLRRVMSFKVNGEKSEGMRKREERDVETRMIAVFSGARGRDCGPEHSRARHGLPVPEFFTGFGAGTNRSRYSRDGGTTFGWHASRERGRAGDA